MEQSYTVKQAAKILNRCTNTVYTLLREGKIRAIRIGRGKFKIPQEEIDRLLAPAETSGNLPAVKEMMPAVEINVPRDEIGSLKFQSFFDWIIGMASIIFGASLFLVNRIDQSVSQLFLLRWFFLLKVFLVVTGIGLLVSSLWEEKHQNWKKFFHILFFLTYSAVCFFWFTAGDYFGVSIWGFLIIIFGLRLVFQIDSLKSFLLYLSLIGVTAPFSLLYSRQTILPRSLLFLFGQPAIAAGIILFLFLILILVLRFVFKKNNLIFWCLFCLILTFFLLISQWSAQKVHWEKTFFLLYLTLVGYFVAYWRGFKVSFRRGKTAIFNTFVFISFFLLSLIVFNYIFQRNCLREAQKNLLDKADYGQFVVDQSLISGKEILKKTAVNSILVSQLSLAKQDKQIDKELLFNLIKPLAGNRLTFEKMMVLNTEGDILVSYPYDLSFSSEDDAADRDFFAGVKKDSLVSAISFFDEKTKKAFVVVVAPVVDDKKNFLGMLAGYLDLDILSQRLQEIAVFENKEAFSLLDEGNNYLVYSKHEPVPSLEASRDIKEEDWRVLVKAPIADLLSSKNISLWTFYLVVEAGVLMTMLFLVYLKGKYKR